MQGDLMRRSKLSNTCVACPCADRVRVPAALRGVQRHGREERQEVHRSKLCGAVAGAIRQRGPTGARVPEDHSPPHLWQVHGAPPLHPQGHQQRLLPVHL